MSLPVKVEQSPHYRTINVGGVYGTFHPMYFEVLLYSNDMIPDKILSTTDTVQGMPDLKRIIESRLILDPFMAKVFYMWLGNHIKRYEDAFGVIPSPEEVKAKLLKAQNKDNNIDR